MATSSLKRILVTGGAGFLGSHLCDRLVAQGHDIICLDNFFTSQKHNVAHLLPKSNFELIRHDVVEPIFLEVDEIYNLACPASPVHYQYNPVKTVNPSGIRACYDEGKRCAETLFFDYHRSNHVNVRVIRIFNTYGPRMHPYDGRVVSNFILQALQGQEITIYGDGKQTRSFCYVDDLIEGMMRMMNGPDSFIGPINIGNPGEFTMMELAQLVLEMTGSKAKITHLPRPKDDPSQRRPDITLAKKNLNWEPKVALKEGLSKTIDFFRTIDLKQYRKPTDHTAHKSSE